MKSRINKSGALRVALATGLVVVGLLQFQGAARANEFLSSFTRFLSPGELTGPHAQDEKLKDCYACHTLTKGIDDSLCLDCHKAVKTRLAGRKGYHGKFEESCVACHADHKGIDSDIVDLNAETFNHRQADYALTGKHAEIDCDKCHPKKGPEDAVKTRYIDLSFGKCVDCHKDPHPADFDIDCLKCHTTAGWSGRALLYSHKLDSRFRLLGKHQEVSCDKCHKGPELEAQFTLPNTTCLNCHADAHNKQLSQQCEDCHNEFGWTGRNLGYSHALDSKFKLAGKHQALSCQKCHKTADPRANLGAAQFRNIGTDCLKCHTDEHKGSLSEKCQECHNEFGWTGRNLNYSHASDSKYKLAGKHQALSCDKCHKPAEPGAKLGAAQFTDIGTDCLACHEDEHKEQLSKTCRECHNESGWKGAFVTFDHNEQSTYKLDATHQSTACADCHQEKKYKPLKSECVDCHGEYGSIMAGRPNETAAQVEADPHWKRVRCDQCHDALAEDQRLALYQDKCVECHNQRYGPLLLDWMKDWSRSRLEIQGLLRQAAEEEALSASGLESISRGVTEAEKIGAHNFLLAPNEWKALKADLERKLLRDLAM